MFQFPAFASCIGRMTVLQTAGLSHSETRGSMVICTYPRIIAAYHVLHRLREPRHPPYALNYFVLHDVTSYRKRHMSRYLGFVYFRFAGILECLRLCVLHL